MRADAAFWDDAFLTELEDLGTRLAVVAQIRKLFRHLLPGLNYRRVNADWEMAECEYQAPTWSEPRRHVLARRLVETAEHHLTPFRLGRYYSRGWVTNLDLTPPGVWHFYDGLAAIEVHIRELREGFAFGHIPTRAFAANRLYLEVVRLAYNLVTAFQRACLPDDWQSFTLRTLRHKLLLLPGALVDPIIDRSFDFKKHPTSKTWPTISSARLRSFEPSPDIKWPLPRRIQVLLFTESTKGTH